VEDKYACDITFSQDSFGQYLYTDKGFAVRVDKVRDYITLQPNMRLRDRA